MQEAFNMRLRKSTMTIYNIIIVVLLLLLFRFWYKEHSMSPVHCCPCIKQTITETAKTYNDHQLDVNTSFPTRYTSFERPSVSSETSNNISDSLLKPDKHQPTIFIITPTYTRDVQKAELTRQCQTFTLVNDIHWIVIEDSDTKTELVDKLLTLCPIKTTLLNRETSAKLKTKTTVDNKAVNRGAIQRNIGLEWLREHYKPGDIDGVVYFADDDNTYDVRLFEEMRYTKKVSIWPVAFAGGLKSEGPICKDGRVTGFHVSWTPRRKFPVDMAAFAINLDIFLANHKIELDPLGEIGRLETNLLSMILKSRKELEGRANDCTEVLVWHTETKSPWLHYENKNPSHLEV